MRSTPVLLGIPALPDLRPGGDTLRMGLANRKIGGGHEAVEAILRHDRFLIRPGQVIVGGKGFAGTGFETFITDNLDAKPTRTDRR